MNNVPELLYYRGRVGLYHALKELGVDKTSEVILQAFTCIANPEAVMATGAKVIYADIEINGCNICTDSLTSLITDKTAAIIIQHTFGVPADMSKIIQIAEKHSIPIIEDCCHTHRSKCGDAYVGSFGSAAFFSYEWGKPVVAGVGGSLVVNDEKLELKLKEVYSDLVYPPLAKTFRLNLQYFMFRLLYRPGLYWPVKKLYHSLGRSGLAESNYNPVSEGSFSEEFGMKMARSVRQRLITKLKDVDDISRHSEVISNIYSEGINNSSQLTHITTPQDSHTVYARYPLMVEDKQALLLKARESNIEIADWYSTPAHPVISEDYSLINYKEGSCPNAEGLCGKIISLPVHRAVTTQYAEKTVNFLNSI